MKTFDELTIDQKLEAYVFARKALEESLQLGLIEMENTFEPEEVVDMVEEIAENGTYTDDGKPYVEEMDVPFHFLGGCV